jgi:excisionase family DNA binding protein
METRTIIDTLRGTRRPLTVRQCSDILGLHPQTVYKWSRTGRIPVLRLGSALRFDPIVIAQWVESRSL